MGEAQKQETALEQELDELYRKVAGLDPEEDPPAPEAPKPAKAVARPAARIRTRDRRRPARVRRRHLVPVVAVVAVLLLAAALLYPLAAYRHGTLAVGGAPYPSKTHRLTGETTYFNGEAWLRPPLPEKAPGRAAGKTVPPLEPPGAKPAEAGPEAPAAGRLPGGSSGGYAIQLRAYPEAQKANAVLFWEELRKREPDAALVTVRIEGQGVWHRVLVGRFATAEEAANYQKGRGLDREYPYSFIQTLGESRP